MIFAASLIEEKSDDDNEHEDYCDRYHLCNYERKVLNP